MAQHAWYTPLGLPVLNPPLSPTFFGGSKANSAANGSGFQFFHRIFVREFNEPLIDNSIKKSFKKEKVNRAFLILSFEFKCQLLFNLQVLFTDPWGSPRPFQGIYKAKMVLIILPNCSLPFSLGWYLHWWHRAAAGKDAGTQIGIKAWLPTVPAGSVSLFFSVTVPAQYQIRRKGRFSCW